MNTYIQPESRMNVVKRVLAWLSGANARILSYCHSEQNYYFALGTLVVLTSLLAGTGMALTFVQTGSSSDKAVLGGVLWFLCILNLDRFLLIVSYDNKGWKRFLPVMRFMLSLCVAIIIGENIVHYLFRSEINSQLAQESLVAQKNNHEQARASMPELADLENQRIHKQAEVDNKQIETNKRHEEYIKEAEGTGGSGIPGKGDLYDEKKRDYETSLSEKLKLQEELKDIDRRIEEKNLELKEKAGKANEAKANERGFLAHHRALFAIIKQDKTLLFIYCVISLSLILFEVSPLLAKVGGKKSLHDEMIVKELELQREEEEKRRTIRLQNLENELKKSALIDAEVSQIQRETFVKVADSIRRNTHSTLDQDEAEIAVSIKEYVYDSLIHEVKSRYTGKVIIKDGEEDEESFDSSKLSPVKIAFKDDEDAQPFTILFGRPKENLRGRDLTHTLAGLEQQRSDTTGPRIPLYEYKMTNDQDQPIDHSLLLFPQISRDSTVYLSLFEPTVSNAEN